MFDQIEIDSDNESVTDFLSEDKFVEKLDKDNFDRSEFTESYLGRNNFIEDNCLNELAENYFNKDELVENYYENESVKDYSNTNELTSNDDWLENNKDETDNLYVGKRFVSWQEVIKFLNYYCKQKRFGYRKECSKKSEGLEDAKKRTFLCKHAGTYKPNKSAGLDQQRNKPSCKVGCMWYINIAKKGSLNATKQYQMLLSKYQCCVVKQDLYNAIHIIRHKKEPAKNDPFNVLNFLLEKKADNPEWVVEVIQQALGLCPPVIITDADPAMDAAIVQTYPKMRYLHCIWHIGQNLPKNLKNKLYGNYEDFAKKFFQCHNKLSIESFEYEYVKLIEDYPAAASYLKHLYKSKKSWTRCYTSSCFTARMQSTSRIKSVNGIIKKDLDGRCVSLNDLCTSITRILKKHQNHKEFVAWKETMPIITPPNIYNIIFREIDSELHNCVTLAITEKIREQINHTCIDEVFDLSQTLANTILKTISDWVCRHFLRIICTSPEARFHINMINHHWLNDNVYGSDLNNKNFIRLVNEDTNTSGNFFYR
ncbi:2400_t:CDS:2, partial [Racocetra persica]